MTVPYDAIIAAIAARGHRDDREYDKFGHDGVLTDPEPIFVTPSPTTTPQVQLDYAGRTDNNPVYIGTAATDVADATVAWRVTKLGYDGSSRAIHLDRRDGISWNNRANPAADGQPAWQF